MPKLTRFPLFLALAACIPAQDTADRQPKFVLPAGTYALDELIGRIVQARGTPIRLDEAAREMLHDHRIVLHHELQLPPQGFADVAATLLLQQGVVLVRDEEDGQLQAVRMSDHGNEFAQFAEPRTVTEVLTHPHRAACVTTVVGTGALKPGLVRNFLRPYMGSSTDRWNLKAAVEDDKIRLTGLTDQVAFGIALVRHVSHQVSAPALSLPAWEGGDQAPHRWPGGRLKRSELLALAAVELGCNLVHADDSDEDLWIELGKPAQLHASDWFTRLAVTLRGEDMVLLPVVAEHRVFQLVDSSGPLGKVPAWHTLFVTPEEVEASTHLLSVTVVIRPSVAASTAANALIPSLPRMKGLSIGSMGPKHMMISGPRDYVAEALRIVQAL